MMGFQPDEDVERIPMSDYLPPQLQPYLYEEVLPSAARDGLWRGELALARRDGREIPVSIVVLAHRAPDGTPEYFSAVVRDISEQKHGEEALRQAILQEEVIRAQAATLAELSTPLIPISDDVMVMPLIGSVDSRRAQQVLESLLSGVAERRARVAILDITGVTVVDTQVANGIVRAAQAVKLLGAQVILTGIRPEVAQTLVGLGVDLSGIVTRGSLQSGIALAIERH
jgi:rsbT co-antagonist protein RsbR